MKNRWKKMLGILLVAAVVSGLMLPAASVRAASEPVMGKLKLNWDLKPEKKAEGTYICAGNVETEVALKLSNYKSTTASKEGYKKLSFTVTMSYGKLTPEQVGKVVNSEYFANTESIGAYPWFAVVDYNTGLDLETENEYGVTVTSPKWKNTKENIYYGSKGEWVRFVDIKTRITVLYPDDYKGLCIGVGGANVLRESEDEASFWDGKLSFGKTDYYTKGKSNSHWMRVIEE